MPETASEKGKGKVEVFDSEEDLSVSLAKYIADLADKFSQQKGTFTVVLSGGSLIKFLRYFCYESLTWHDAIFQIDATSDFRRATSEVLDAIQIIKFRDLMHHSKSIRVPILPGHVYSINDALPAEDAADDYETCLRHLVTSGVISTSAATGFPKFDIMLLGMGPDGHVASLFPGHSLVKENEKWGTFIKDSPKPPPERITFTFPVINSSVHIALVVCGAGKAGPVHAALGNSQNSNPLPVQMVSPEGELVWFLDKDAASKL